MVKPGYQHPIDVKTLDRTKTFYEDILRLIQPFTPFIAEEMWHSLREREDGDDAVVAKWPEVKELDEAVLSQFNLATEVITHIRNIRKKNNIANKVKIDLFIKMNKSINKTFDSVIVKMGNLTKLEYIDSKVDSSNSFIVDGNEYFIPFGDIIDVEAEKEKMSEELDYTQGFLKSVQKKLQNEKFVTSAPEQVVQIERKKEEDALSKIAILEEKIAALN
jgi:valyl-tRNA synthetase